MHMDANEMAMSGCTSFQMGKPRKDTIFKMCFSQPIISPLYMRVGYRAFGVST